MRPRTAFFTILLAAVLATAVIGVGTRATVGDGSTKPPAMRSI